MIPEQQTLAFACRELAAEIASGPSFFDEKGRITSAVERYTGARLTKDADRCAMVAALVLLHYSDRQIAEIMKCDVRSIPLMVREIEKTGAIPALKDRLVLLTGQNAEQSSIALRDLIHETLGGERSIEQAAMISSVGKANDFLTTKHQLLTGAPTQISSSISGPRSDEVAEWGKANAIPVESAVDSDSTAKGVNPQQTLPSPTDRPADGTDQPPSPSSPPSSPPPRDGEGGGGGSTSAGEKS